VLLEGMPPEYYDDVRLLILFLSLSLIFSKSVGFLIPGMASSTEREDQRTAADAAGGRRRRGEKD